MIINRSCTSDIRNISRLTCKGLSPHFSFLFLYRLNGYFHLHKRSLHATRRLNSFIFCQECPYDELECIGLLAVKYIGVKSKGQTVKSPTNLHLCQSTVSFQLKSNEFTSSFFLRHTAVSFYISENYGCRAHYFLKKITKGQDRPKFNDRTAGAMETGPNIFISSEGNGCVWMRIQRKMLCPTHRLLSVLYRLTNHWAEFQHFFSLN